MAEHDDFWPCGRRKNENAGETLCPVHENRCRKVYQINHARQKRRVMNDLKLLALQEPVSEEHLQDLVAQFESGLRDLGQLNKAELDAYHDYCASIEHWDY